MIPVCPEQLGGLGTPRQPAEIRGGAGAEVLEGEARVVTSDGTDVTSRFIAGAEETLVIAGLSKAGIAVLKARSPSCGVRHTYDGTFTHTLQPGSGVTAALLERAGMALHTEEDCAALLGEAPYSRELDDRNEC